MRMLVYTLLDGYVSSGKLNQTIQRIGSALGVEMLEEDIPSRPTVDRMQLELGVISDMQVI